MEEPPLPFPELELPLEPPLPEPPLPELELPLEPPLPEPCKKEIVEY